jgi:hypothetical protein
MRNRGVLFTLFLALSPCLFAGLQEAPEEESRPAYQPQTEAEIESILDEIFSSPDYRSLGRTEPDPDESEEESNLPGWLERFFDWLGEWLSSLSSSSEDERSDVQFPSLAWLRWVVYGIVIAVLTWIITLIVKAILERASREEPIEMSQKAATDDEVASTPPGEHPSQEYLHRALALAEAADYRAAIRQLLLGTMSWIERHDLIRYRRGLSNRDYLRAVRGRPPLLDPLSRIVLNFERIYFGRREASAQGFQECLQHFRKAFEAE